MAHRNMGYLAITAFITVVFLWHALMDFSRGEVLTGCGDLVMTALCAILFDSEYNTPTSIL
jgi:hypothetical protein